MSLLQNFFTIISEWNKVFCQKRTMIKAIQQVLGSLTTLGRKTISRIIASTGRDQVDWTSEYRLHSQCKWNHDHLFHCIIKNGAPLINGKYISAACDDTKISKTGKKIKTAFYQRDPMSPPFHVNLMYGLRFLQTSLIIPLYQGSNTPPRGIPISFMEVPNVKKPKKKASEDEWEISANP